MTNINSNVMDIIAFTSVFFVCKIHCRGIFMKRYYKSEVYFAKILVMLMMTVFLAGCRWDVHRSSAVIDPVYEDGVSVESGDLRITQYGITWIVRRTSGTPYILTDSDHGQFANGDYWVVGPVKIINIYPRTVTVDGRTINGSMLNPVPGWNQGYDSAITKCIYQSELNVALGVSSATPLALSADTSLISTISRSATGVRPLIQGAAILTVLSTAASSGSFRPPYCGADKTVKFNVSQLNYSLLSSITPAGGVPDLADVERMFERPWIDHFEQQGGEEAHPLDNMANYGRELAANMGLGALMLHLNFTDEQKKTLLVRFVQLGIDNFGIIQNGGSAIWSPNGGHCQGRKWPILFAGIVLNDSDMKNIGVKSGAYLYTSGYGPGNIPSDYIRFGEDAQTFYVTADDVARTNSSDWDPDTRVGTPAPYTNDDIGLPEWGIRHANHPFEDNKDWLAVYRVVNAKAWAGFILAARIMESGSSARTLWNHQALFDYQDRYMAVTAELSNNPAWRTSVAGMDAVWGTHTGERQLGAFVENMWDQYRDDY